MPRDTYTPPLSGPRADALRLLKERRPYPPGSSDYDYRTRAAWKLLQHAMGKHPQDWTDTPPRRTQ